MSARLVWATWMRWRHPGRTRGSRRFWQGHSSACYQSATTSIKPGTGSARSRRITGPGSTSTLRLRRTGRQPQSTVPGRRLSRRYRIWTWPQAWVIMRIRAMADGSSIATVALLRTTPQPGVTLCGAHRCLVIVDESHRMSRSPSTKKNAGYFRLTKTQCGGLRAPAAGQPDPMDHTGPSVPTMLDLGGRVRLLECLRRGYLSK